jgi:hypothetical protein
MGTDGAIEITVGDDVNHCIAWWYREPAKAATVSAADAKKKAEPFVAGATMVSTSGVVKPIPIMTSDLDFSKDESFFGREGKFARRWLTSKGILAQEEQKNPVDTELEHFFEGCRAAKTIVSPIEIGMNDAIAVILSNLSMDEGRKVYFNEIEQMGIEPQKHLTQAPKPAPHVGG